MTRAAARCAARFLVIRLWFSRFVVEAYKLQRPEHPSGPLEAPKAPMAEQETTRSRWKTVRPWLPPRSDASPRRLELEVVDVSSTAVSLSVFAPGPSPEEAAAVEATEDAQDSTWNESSAPAISIKLNGRPWSQVAHAGSPIGDDISGDESEEGDAGERKRRRRGSSSSLSPKRGEGTTIVIYGLEPGQEYEVELDVLDGDDDPDGTGEPQPAAHETRRSRIITRGSQSPCSLRQPHSLNLGLAGPTTQTPSPSLTPTTSEHADPDGPPPPYTSHDPASSPSADAQSAASASKAPDEAQLRGLLKKVRATGKRQETALTASITTLKRTLDKAVREDQRARQRAITLEDSTRKASENAERDIAEAESIEAETTSLEGEVSSGEARVAVRREEVDRATKEADREVDEGREGVRTLKKRRDELAKKSDEVKKEHRKVERDLAELERALRDVDEEISRVDAVPDDDDAWLVAGSQQARRQFSGPSSRPFRPYGPHGPAFPYGPSLAASAPSAHVNAHAREFVPRSAVRLRRPPSLDRLHDPASAFPSLPSNPNVGSSASTGQEKGTRKRSDSAADRAYTSATEPGRQPSKSWADVAGH